MQQRRELVVTVQAELLSASFREKAQAHGSPSECLNPQEQRQQCEQHRPSPLPSKKISSPRLLYVGAPGALAPGPLLIRAPTGC